MESPELNRTDKTDGTATGLTAAQAATLLKGDLANIAKKVKGGKPLSKGERDLLQASISGGVSTGQEFCDTQDELGRIIGVTRKTIQRWRKLDGCPEPRSDGRWHIPSWQQFKITRMGDDDEDEDGAVLQAVAKARQILLQNERLEMKILCEKKELIPKAVAQQVFSKLVLAAKTRCFMSVTRFVTLARMAESSDAAAGEVRKEMILIWQEMESGKWMKDSTTPEDKMKGGEKHETIKQK